MSPQLGSTFPRFLLVGLLAMAVYVLSVLMAETMELKDAGLANQLGLALAFGVGYWGQRRWVFRLSGHHRLHLVRFSTQILAVCLIFQIVEFFLGDATLSNRLVGVSVFTIAVLMFGYLASRFWAMVHQSCNEVDATSWVALGTVASLFVAVQVFFRLNGTSFNHDTSWFFIATRMWSAGASLYSDVMEINPPLIFYLIRLVQIIGACAGLSDEASLRMVLFMLVGASVFLTNRALTAPVIPALHRAVMMVVGTVALLVIPMSFFGQREHLFVIFVLPYLTNQAMRLSGLDVPVWLRIVSVVFAIPGLLLKPYFLLLPLLLSLCNALLARRVARLVSLENVFIAAASLAYLASVYSLHPNYVQSVVPLGQLVYFAFGRSFEDVVFNPLLLILPLCCLPMLFGDYPANNRRFLVALFVASAACLIMYLLQFKGWAYHLIPYQVTVFLLAGWLLVSGIGTRSWVWGVIPFAILLKVVVLPQIDQGAYRSASSMMIRSSVNIEAGSSVMVYSTSVSLAFPFVNEAKLEWTSRYPAQWIVPGAFIGFNRTPVADAGRRDAYAVALGYARKTAVEDFLKSKPAYVVVDVRRVKSYFGGYSFDWIDFLSQDAGFKEGWADYLLIRKYKNIQVWRRKNAESVRDIALQV